MSSGTTCPARWRRVLAAGAVALALGPTAACDRLAFSPSSDPADRPAPPPAAAGASDGPGAALRELAAEVDAVVVGTAGASKYLLEDGTLPVDDHAFSVERVLRGDVDRGETILVRQETLTRDIPGDGIVPAPPSHPPLAPLQPGRRYVVLLRHTEGAPLPPMVWAVFEVTADGPVVADDPATPLPEDERRYPSLDAFAEALDGD